MEVVGTVPSNMRRNSSSQLVVFSGREIGCVEMVLGGGVRRVGGGVSASLQSFPFSLRFLNQLKKADAPAINRKMKKDSILASILLFLEI